MFIMCVSDNGETYGTDT